MDKRVARLIPSTTPGELADDTDIWFLSAREEGQILKALQLALETAAGRLEPDTIPSEALLQLRLLAERFTAATATNEAERL